MNETREQKCACGDCVCIVTLENAIEANNSLYCSESCSNGHIDGQGCGHNCGCVGNTEH